MKNIVKSLRLSQEQWENIENKAKEQEQNFSSFALSTTTKFSVLTIFNKKIIKLIYRASFKSLIDNFLIMKE